MTIDVTNHELDIILCALNGTTFEKYDLEVEKRALITRLVDEKGENNGH